MRPIITVSAVVLLHLCVIAMLVGVNGCRSTSGFEQEGDLAAYSAGARPTGNTAVHSPTAPAPVATAVAPTDKITTPAPTKVTPTKAVGAGGTYTVKANDSFFVIASREGVSASALAAANGLQLNSVLRVGQKLKIPTPDRTVKALAPKSSNTKTEAPATPKDTGPTFTPLKLVPLTGAAPAETPANGSTTPTKQ